MIHCSECKGTIENGCLCYLLDDEDEDQFIDSVEDWELLGLDPDTPQEEIDRAWENQM